MTRSCVLLPDPAPVCTDGQAPEASGIGGKIFTPPSQPSKAHPTKLVLSSSDGHIVQRQYSDQIKSAIKDQKPPQVAVLHRKAGALNVLTFEREQTAPFLQCGRG
jgi:hypothetical protein